MLTTYVGSFPLPNTEENVRRIVRDVCSIGVDYPNYPQLSNFVDQFLEPIAGRGIVKVGKAYVLEDRGFEYTVGESLLKPLKITLEEGARCSRFKGFRACATGPFTLASFIFLSPNRTDLMNSALRYHDVVWKLAEYIREVVKVFVELGFNYINIDEPTLGVLVGRNILFGYTQDDVVDVLNHVLNLSGVEYRGVHVCGRLNPNLIRLLSSVANANLLDHEFADSPTNIGLFDRELLRGKDLAVGVVSSRRPVVERVEDVLGLYRRVAERVGEDRVIALKPDCGFSSLRAEGGDLEASYLISLEKLRRIVEAKSLISK